MKEYFKLKTWIILFLMIAIGVSLSTLIVVFEFKDDIMAASAAEEYNIHGFAWSSTFGWISFNYQDCDIDGDEVFEGADEVGGPAPTGCPASGAVIEYGVSMASDGQLSGYAWSSNAGWIYFGPGDGSTLTDAPADPKVWAKIANGNLDGWAKILNLGDDGWINFNTEAGATGGKVSYNQTTGEFSGWAYGGNENLDIGIGWISFNCADYNVCQSGSKQGEICTEIKDNSTECDGQKCDTACGLSDYGVYVSPLPYENTPPTVTPNRYYYSNLCGGSNEVYLPWNYSDQEDDADTGDEKDQSGYQLQIGISPADFDTLPIIESSEASKNARQYIFDNPSFNTTYDWRIRVKDSDGNWSDWKNGESFKTIKNYYPKINSISFDPENPGKDQEVIFSAEVVPDTNNGATIISHHWTFAGGDPATAEIANPTVSFTQDGKKEITLYVIDSSGYGEECVYESTLDVKPKLPTWIETGVE